MEINLHLFLLIAFTFNKFNDRTVFESKNEILQFIAETFYITENDNKMYIKELKKVSKKENTC